VKNSHKKASVTLRFWLQCCCKTSCCLFLSTCVVQTVCLHYGLSVWFQKSNGIKYTLPGHM